MARNTAKEQRYLMGAGGKPIPTKFRRLPGYMKSQNGPVKVIKKANKKNADD